MSEQNEKFAEESRLLRETMKKPLKNRIGVYLKLSGPGWMQSAMTLGGGSLAGSLYLGVIAGFGMMWLQPLAMIFGIIMLSAIGYVTMSTGERPFKALNEHINPVLGWGWALGSLLASIVWSLPQYSLSVGVLEQNLLPGVFGAEGILGQTNGRILIVTVIFAISLCITWNYGSGGKGVKLFEIILKTMVAMIVLCFIGVTLRLGFSPQGIAWGEIFRGFIPDPGLIFRPADGFQPILQALPEIDRQYWTNFIVGQQRDVMTAAAATAVGINMTFLFPYSILRRGWGREFIGLSKFDLGTGMLIPFTIATSCVIIAAATQFHAIPQPGLMPSPDAAIMQDASPRMIGQYNNLLKGLVEHRAAGAEIPAGEIATRVDSLGPEARRMAATLVTRDAFDLAASLRPLTGDFFASIIFGLGVLGMTFSTITLLMLICGFVVCEIFNLPHTGWPLRLGSLLGALGMLGPFFWSQAAFYLAVPTSVFAFMLIPIAYISFFLMMNQRTLLGDAMPAGRSRIAWNALMGTATVVISVASVAMLWTNITSLWSRGGTAQIMAGFFIAILAIILILTAVFHFRRSGKREART